MLTDIGLFLTARADELVYRKKKYRIQQEYEGKGRAQWRNTMEREGTCLEIPSMRDVAGSILTRYDVQDLKHIVQYPISRFPVLRVVVVLIVTNKALDLAERLLNWIEIREVQGEIFDGAKAIC